MNMLQNTFCTDETVKRKTTRSQSAFTLKYEWFYFFFFYLFLFNKCAVVLTPSFSRTHGHSHTKGCLPLRFLAVSPNA